MRNNKLFGQVVVLATAAIPAISMAGFLSHDQVVRTCQAKRKTADQMMQARQAGKPKSELEDQAYALPVIAGETGPMLLNRVYQQPVYKAQMREYETAIFAAKVYRECNKKLGS